MGTNKELAVMIAAVILDTVCWIVVVAADASFCFGNAATTTEDARLLSDTAWKAYTLVGALDNAAMIASSSSSTWMDDIILEPILSFKFVNVATLFLESIADTRAYSMYKRVFLCWFRMMK